MMGAKERERNRERNRERERKEKEKEREKETQLKTEKTQKANEVFKANAKTLAADAVVAYKKERKKYVEERARDIHENMLPSNRFDVDALRAGGILSEISSRL